MLRDSARSQMNFLSFLSAVFWCIIVFLYSGSPFQTFMNLNAVVFMGGLLSILLLLNRIKHNLDLSAKVFLLLFCMVFFTMASHFEFARLFYWRYLSVLIMSIALAKHYGAHRIINVFKKIMVFVSLISILGYILVNNTEALNWLPRVDNVNGVEYAIGGIFNYITAVPERNCGIFWEPGIFATYLIFALVFEILSPSKKHRGLCFLIYIIALITANSTAGFLLGAFVLLLSMVSRLNTKKIGFSTFFSVILLCVMLYFLYNLDNIILSTSLIENEYIVKLLSENLEDSARVTVVEHNLAIFFSEPMFGAGVTTVSKNMIECADISTLTYILSIFGIFGLTMIVGFAVGIFRQRNINLFQKIVFIAIIIAILSKEPHLESVFIWILFFSMLNDKNSFTKEVN